MNAKQISLPLGTLAMSLLLAAHPADAQITYVDAVEGATGNTYATGSTLDDTSWIDLTTNISSNIDSTWLKRFGGSPGWSEHNGGDVIQSQVSGFPHDLPELTTEITGLADGRYDVWVFFWNQIASETQDWVIDAGLTSGATAAYSDPGDPVAGTNSTLPVNAATLDFNGSVRVVGAGGNQNMIGVNLGWVSVADGAPINVFIDKIVGTGSRTRTIYDGVGYEFVGPLAPPELVSTDELTATFNEAVRAGASGTITLKRASDDSTVEVLDVNDTTAPGTVTFSDTSVIVEPTADLVGGTEYYVLVDPGAIESLVSQAFPGITTSGEWSFTTDGTAPSSIDMFPMAGALGIQPNADLTLNFDEDVLAVGGKFLTLHLADGTVVETIDAATVIVSGGEVVIPVAATLALDASYYVTVEAGAFTDLIGNPFAGISDPSVWSFSTAVTPIHYVDAVEGAAGNTFATGSTLADTSWVGPDEVSANETQWNKRGLASSTGGSIFQGWTSVMPPPELTTRIDGLADGTYLIWAFYWDHVESDSNNWVLSAGLTSGDLTTYSSPGEPAVAGATAAGVTKAADLTFTNLEPDGSGSLNLFGVELGIVEVSGGSPVEVFLGNDLVAGFANRAWYDGVGYQLVTPAADPRITSFTSVGADVWEVTLRGAPETTYEFRASSDLVFDPGALVTGLTQADPGTIGGDDDSQLTTDATGDATVWMMLSGPRNFVRAQPPLPLLSEDFEEGDGGFTVATTAGTPWALGTPDSSGLGGSVTAGNGGSGRCWGTGIGNPGFYEDPTDTCLRSPVVDLTGITGAELSFAQALDLEPTDSVTLNIIDDVTDTVIVADLLSISDEDLESASWQTIGPVAIPAAALGQPVRIEWCLSGTGGSLNDYMGWYIDDVMIEEVSP